MTIYEYKCVGGGLVDGRAVYGCGTHRTSTERMDKMQSWCHDCDPGQAVVTTWQRVWNVAVKPMMHEHFNHTLGKPIGDMNRFATELRIAGEKAEEQTGIPHRYAPLEYGDHEAFGATGEGIYESNVDRSRRGEPLLPLIE